MQVGLELNSCVLCTLMLSSVVKVGKRCVCCGGPGEGGRAAGGQACGRVAVVRLTYMSQPCTVYGVRSVPVCGVQTVGSSSLSRGRPVA